MSTRSAVAAAIAVVAFAVAPVQAEDSDPPTVRDLCAAPLQDQLPPDDPLMVELPEPVIASLDICASWYRPVLDDEQRLVAVEFSTRVAGDLTELPPDAFFTWDWFDEEGTCFHQAVVTLSSTADPRVSVRDQCQAGPPPPLVDFVLEHVAGTPVIAVPSSTLRLEDRTVTLRLDRAELPARVAEILAPGRVLTRPHTHAGVVRSDAGPQVHAIETARDDPRDVPLS